MTDATGKILADNVYWESKSGDDVGPTSNDKSSEVVAISGFRGFEQNGAGARGRVRNQRRLEWRNPGGAYQHYQQLESHRFVFAPRSRPILTAPRFCLSDTMTITSPFLATPARSRLCWKRHCCQATSRSSGSRATTSLSRSRYWQRRSGIKNERSRAFHELGRFFPRVQSRRSAIFAA